MTNDPNRDNLSESEIRDRGIISGTNETNSDRQPIPASPTPFQKGYVDGRTDEQIRYEQNLEARDNSNAASGLLTGILATGALAVVIGSIFLLNQANNRPIPVVPQVTQPAAPQASPQQPNTKTEIRERETIREVPVPAAPDVRITVPSAPPAQAPTQTQPAPRQQDSAPAGEANQSPTQPAPSSSPSAN